MKFKLLALLGLCFGVSLVHSKLIIKLITRNICRLKIDALDCVINDNDRIVLSRSLILKIVSNVLCERSPSQTEIHRTNLGLLYVSSVALHSKINLIRVRLKCIPLQATDQANHTNNINVMQ